MADFPNFKLEDAIPHLCPETQMNFRKILQAAGIENVLINDGRRISDTDVLNEIRKEVAMLSVNESEELTTSLIPACINGDIDAVKAMLATQEYDVNEVTSDGETALTCAVSANALRVVEFLLNHGANPNFRGRKVDCTPLMEAASAGYSDIVKVLLEHGACVGQKSNTGNTALHYAATSGHLECVRLLLQYNSPMEVQNETGHTPLMETTSNGYIDVARCLIEHGCDINTHSTEFKESALTLASYKGHAEMVKFLLESGADHEHRTDEMHTALMEAAMEGHVEVARLLLNHGANVNIPQDSFESPLTLAACGGHTELAHLLIGYGADIEEVNDEGYTPLMEAAREGHEETVALLLAVGADVNARTDETQETALTLAACGGFIEVCEMLLNAGADIEVGGVGCSTPLMEAAQEGHLELVHRLLERGAAVNAVTATGDTALHYAAENGHVKVCSKLLDWNAVFGAMTEGGRTPLMKAARNGNLEVVQLFIERGAPIDQLTSQQDANALSLACSGGHAKVVKYLLQHGADPQSSLRDGCTMLIEAARSGNPTVLRLILDYPMCLTQPLNLDPVTPASAGVASTSAITSIVNGSQLPVPQPLAAGTVYNQSISVAMGMPPPPPPGEPCPTHAAGIGHLHHHQHLAAYQHHHHPPPLCGGTGGTVTTMAAVATPIFPSNQTGSVSATGHLDTASLVNAYAVGWADGAASLVQHHQQHMISSSPLVEESEDATCETARLSATSVNASECSVPTSCVITTAATVFKQQEAVTSDGIANLALTATGGVDFGPEFSAGLLHAFIKDFMHDPKTDREELIRTFQSALYSPGGVLPAMSQPQSSSTSGGACSIQPVTHPTSLNVNWNRLVDQQQQQLCRVRNAGTFMVNPADGRPLNGNSCSAPFLCGSGVHGVAHHHQLTPQHADVLGLTDDGDLVVHQLVSLGQQQQPPQQRRSGVVDQFTAIGQHKVQKQQQDTSGSCNPTPVLSSCHSSSSSSSSSSASSSSPSSSSISSPSVVSTASSPECSITDIVGVQQHVMSGVSGGVGPNNSPVTTVQQQQQPPMLQKAAASVAVGLQSRQVHDFFASCRQSYHQHTGPHMGCSLEAANAAVVTGLAHPGMPPPMHHHHHHHHLHHHQQQQQPQHYHQQHGHTAPLPMPGPDVRLHPPTAAATAISMDAMMVSSPGTLAYDPAAVLAAQQQVISQPMTAALPVPTVPGTTVDLSVMDDTKVGSSLIDVNACIESSMETALTLTCSGGYLELVRLLLERGADKEHRDKKSHTPLHTAVLANQLAVVSLLLDCGADIEAQVDRTKETALSLACSHGRYELVEELLNRNANKEHRNISDYTPLSLAASGGYVDVIKLLLRYGAEINSRTGSKLGISPLMLASMNGHTNVVRLLLEHGSDINAHIETNRNTALTLACFQGRHEVVQLLVERKANIEHRAKTGLTPLMEAASGDFVEVGLILLDHGADVNASPVPSSRDTALTIAADKGNVKFVDLLLERGAVVEARNKKGATPLWLACNGGHLEVVQSLTQYNAEVNSQDNRKVSCLMAAFRKGHLNVVRLLVQYVTQFPSDKDCLRHIKTAVTDKELAKRCQQCREIIIAAKEKQEGEARKNANCLLEQIEQEEEERANREAVQARKRERKRMKRKAKQEKERMGKEEFPQPPYSTNNHQRSVTGNDEEDEDDDKGGCGSGLLLQRVVDAVGTGEDFGDEIGIPTLRQAIQQVPRQDAKAIAKHESSLHSPISTAPALYLAASSELSNLKNVQKSDSLPSPVRDSVDLQVDLVSHDRKTQQSVSSPMLFTTSENITTSSSAAQVVGTSATTEAKREKHRTKKQSQRAAKRAAAENSVFAGEPSMPVVAPPSSPLLTLEASSGSLSYYPSSNVGASGDSEVNWSAFIESTQNSQLGNYISPTCLVVTSSESNTWTTVLPSSGSRTQRANASGSSSSRTFQDTSADWKTSGSVTGSSRRRISIPVSRHDIGKVIGQGGAVVSALRNMSGIQIDIESARSDEVTERMVYLKGPGDAVQRTYETIQGLLTGSIAGNDVLLMYAALKKSTTTASLTFGRTFLCALNSKAASSGATTLTVPSGATKTTTSTGRSGAATKSGRRTGKTSTTTGTTSSIPSTRSTSQSLMMLNRTGTVASHNNNNSSSSSNTCSIATTLLTSTPPVMTTKVSAPSWSSKLSNGAGKANFASVAAAGLATQPSRSSSKAGDAAIALLGGGSVQASSAPKYIGVPSLMSTLTPTTTTAPVSLLSLNVTPLTTNSQMFPDLAFSLSNNVESLPPDSMDEVSFPPLNQTGKSSRPVPAAAPSSTADDSKVPKSQSPSNLTGPDPVKCEATTSSSVSHKPECATCEFIAGPTAQVPEAPSAPIIIEEVTPTTTSMSCSPASIFKPLSISPPTVAAASTGQTLTPSASAGSHSISAVGTPPVSITQARPFARAPGSERSAHQRNVNVSIAPNTVTASEKYPPSLMSLDIALTCPGVDAPDDCMLLTPTKRAASPEKSALKVSIGVGSMPYAPGQASEWQHPNSITSASNGSEAGQVFPKAIKFSSDAHAVSDLAACINTTAAAHQSCLVSSNSSTLTSCAAAPGGKSLLRPSNDSYHSLMCPPAWSLQPPTDLNPNAAAFQPSAFQPPIAVSNSAYQQHYQQTGRVNALPSSAGASLESQTTVTSGTLSNIRPDYTGSDSLRLQLEGSSIVAPRHPSIRHSQVGPSMALTSSCSTTTAPGSMMAAAAHGKQVLPVNHNVYMEPRLSTLNGFHSNTPLQQQHIQNSTSSLLNSASPQFHSFFSGQSVAQQQQQSNVSGSTISNRLGGGSSSPHTLLNTSVAQLASPYLNAPPYFMQSQQQSHNLGASVVNSPQQQSEATAFSASFINGSTNHPSMSMLSSLSSGVGVHPPTAGTTQPPPVIQPIGAERRRQAATSSSAHPPPPTGLAYPSSSMANGMNYSLHGGQQQQQPSQQATNNATTTNNLLMAFTMNLMQQQQHHLSHPTTAWQQSQSQWSQAASTGGVGSKPPTDMAAYGNTAATGLLSVGGTASAQQQQQSMINAAMAAMASIYPWGAGGGGTPNSLGPPGSGSGAGSALPSSRWLYPPSQAAAIPATSSPAFYADRPPPLNMKSTLPTSSAAASSSAAAAQPLHRPTHD